VICAAPALPPAQPALGLTGSSPSVPPAVVVSVTVDEPSFGEVVDCDCVEVAPPLVASDSSESTSRVEFDDPRVRLDVPSVLVVELADVDVAVLEAFALEGVALVLDVVFDDTSTDEGAFVVSSRDVISGASAVPSSHPYVANDNPAHTLHSVNV
jgi:hypothetical protein